MNATRYAVLTMMIVSAAVARLAIRPTGRWPGVGGITATLSGTEQRGRAVLRGDAASFEWPRMFREPLGVQAARVQLDWRRDDDAWVFVAPQVTVEDPRISLEKDAEDASTNEEIMTLFKGQKKVAHDKNLM